MRQICALEELHGIGVLAGLLALGDGVQVGGELGGIEVVARDIGVRAEDLAPRRQIVGGHRREVELAGRLGVLTVGGDPTQVDAQLADLLGLGGRVDRLE